MTTCKECDKEVGMEELTEGMCNTCLSEEQKKNGNNMTLWDYRNLYTFSGRSDGLNLIIYGVIVPLALVGVGFMIGKGYTVMIGILLALIVGLAAVVRRGRDAGNTPTHTISTLIITSLLMTAIMENTPFGFMIIASGGNFIFGMVMLVMIENFYLVYLVFAKKSEMKVYKTSKFVKIALMLIVGFFVVGVLASLIIPKVA